MPEMNEEVISRNFIENEQSQVSTKIVVHLLVFFFDNYAFCFLQQIENLKTQLYYKHRNQCYFLLFRSRN